MLLPTNAEPSHLETKFVTLAPTFGSISVKEERYPASAWLPHVNAEFQSDDFPPVAVITPLTSSLDVGAEVPTPTSPLVLI